MKNNAILFCKVDREDFWVSGGLTFPVSHTDTYSGSIEELKPLLESKEMVEHVIAERELEYKCNEEFKGELTWKEFSFKGVRFDSGLEFVFEEEYGNEVVARYSCDYVYLSETKPKETTFTVEEIKNYLNAQGSRGDISHFLSEANIIKANKTEEEEC
jgi:hypothetical protein|tara:strand:+ start:7044 stop:7517 length:474 start_codon:yes stop_codon:yes gene_type:complete